MRNLKPLHIILIFFASTLLIQCSKSYKLIDYSSNNYNIDKNLSTNEFLEFDLKNYSKILEKEMNEVLNYSEKDMDIGCPEGLLGNFIADLTLISTIKEVDNTLYFCVLNNGGLRASLPKGKITRGKIYEIMPFDNEIVIIDLTQEQIEELFNYIKNRSLMKDTRKAGVPVSGLRMNINGTKISRIFIGIEEYNDQKKYKLITTDYLANGGDNMDFLKNSKNIAHTGVLLRDAIINYVVILNDQNIKISAELDGRINHAE